MNLGSLIGAENISETAKNKTPGLLSLSLAEARNLPPLTEAQKNKLRHLSVVTLAAKVKVSDSPATSLLSVPGSLSAPGEPLTALCLVQTGATLLQSFGPIVSQFDPQF